MNDPVLEPAAYWTGEAHRALIAFTRSREAALGLTHPQLCLLGALLEQDGRTIGELGRALRPHIATTDDLPAEAEALLDDGYIRVDASGRLWATAAGREACAGVRRHLPEITERIHRGIADADYDAALAVLQQMIRNVT
ncbi:hypothetical protein ACTI_63530 [Actinoplanes sp. OR16]|uniref:MarR family winged helix-turn-helix transcriptional regulator n=1 Tax=Actinoplanes sp. OR16 TaxID=946334 RepID=UPI000F6C1332|nr:MarR family winged helix-turn-helix transcriptional regulator [Actinoplanes sp. OR16]BBH69668.1 hypothetical protein ACTI_63530 [Actinoplanes sp. OR16]